MSVNIYPAYVTKKEISNVVTNEVSHADNWNDESTLNVANANFWSLVDEYNLGHLITSVPGRIRLKTLETAMGMRNSPRYHERLKKLCAVAHTKKAYYIAFS